MKENTVSATTTPSDGYPNVSFRDSTHTFEDEPITFWNGSLAVGPAPV